MNIKLSLGEKIFEVLNIIIMMILIVITLYPVLHVAFASLSNPTLMMAHTGPIFKPMGFTINAYIKVFENPMILIGYKNTIIYVLIGTILNLFLTCIGAYVLSRKDFYWRNILMMGIVFTMFFNGGLIPFYLTIRNLGMMNSMWALILPGAISTMNLIILRTAFQTIPPSMEESAYIDGANDIIILARIVLPLSIPTLAVMTLFYGVAHWNAWFNAMIFLTNRLKYPLQLILREILIESSLEASSTNVSAYDKQAVGETIKYATIMVATVPILMLYPFLQRYFVKGMMIGAVKE